MPETEDDFAAQPLTGGEVDRYVDRLKALASPVRLRLVDMICRGGGELCVCEFGEHCDLSQPTISHHLKKLRDAGIILSRKDGTYVYHRVNPDALEDLSGLVDRLKGLPSEDTVPKLGREAEEENPSAVRRAPEPQETPA